MTLTFLTEKRRILQVAAWYPPYDVGGTEVYLAGLIEALCELGVQSAVLVPRHRQAGLEYEHDGIHVSTYPVNEAPTRKEIRLDLPHLGFDKFKEMLNRHRGAIYHQHSWTRGCGAHHLRAAKVMGFKTVLTIHVPGNICLRGTMMRFGETPCDGPQMEQVCGACWAQNRGLPRPLAVITGKLPNTVAVMARHFPGRVATALSARTLANEKAAQIREMAANADRIVAVCQWLYDALVNTGVPQEKLILSRQGISQRFSQEVQSSKSRYFNDNEPLRLLYLGRFDPVKGIDIAVAAVKASAESTPIRLTIHGISGGEAERAYEADIRRMAAGDERIIVRPPVPRWDLARVMTKHDVLVVPSTWLETGPLVVLEAKAAGLLVLGSKLGGIAELVQEPEDGVLLDPGSVEAWTEAIARFAGEKVRGRLPRRPLVVRTISEAAAEMNALYDCLQGA